jgi:iron complex outermembrane recepter protein
MISPERRPTGLSAHDEGRKDPRRNHIAAAIAMALGTTTSMSSHGQDSTPAARPTDTLETITVYAEKLGRSLLDTATSVVVLDADELERRPVITGANDLLGRIPNITSTGTSNFAPAVRGIDGTGPAQGADAFLAGTRARLNVQLDGRPASYNEIVFGDAGMWDVQQIEVLRGPQSALQGRNAIAGTLSIKTKDPTYQTEAKFRALAGNLDSRQYSGAFSAPIIDEQLAFRIAVDHKTSESFVTVGEVPGVDNHTFEATTVRGKLLIEPKALEGFTTLITLNYSDSSAPQSEEVAAPFENHIAAYPPMPVFAPRTASGIVDMSWKLSDAYTFETRIALTDVEVKREALPGDGNANVDVRETIAEPLLRFNLMDGRLNGLGGLYYFRAEQDDSIDFLGGGSFEDSTRTSAVFGETTLKVSDRFDVTLGARYEEERREREGSLFVFVVDLDETYAAFLPKLVLTWHLSDDLTVGTLAARGYNGGGAGVTFAEPFETYTFEPEYVWNYEAFARATLADGKVMLTGNLFLSDYEDIQLPFSLSALSTVIRNADEAQTYGAELSATWQAAPSLQLSSGFGLLDTKIKNYPDSGVEGNSLAFSPAFTADLGAQYRHAGFELSFDARYSDAYYSDVRNDPRAKTDPYWLVNSQLGYTFSRVRVFGFVNNLLDSGKPVFRYPGDEFNPVSATILRPRTYGIGLQVDL